MEITKLALIGGGIVIGVGIILLAVSFSTVEPTEYGLCYNTFTKSVNNDEVYEGGRHLIGFNKDFKLFPKTQQTIEFSEMPWADSPPLSTRTKEGLALKIHVAFQYQLIKDKIPELYKQSNINFEQTFTRIARDTILQEAGNYDAPQYWTNRTNIGQNMYLLLNESLNEAFGMCRALEILKIGLPDSYEQSIVETQVEVQKTSMKEFEQEAELIRQESNVLISECNQNITAIEAQADADAYYIKQLAVATARKNTLDMQAWVYNQAIQSLAFNQSEFAYYLYLSSIASQPNATILAGGDATQIIINSN